MDNDPLKHFEGEHPGWKLSALHLPAVLKFLTWVVVLVLVLFGGANVLVLLPGLPL